MMASPPIPPSRRPQRRRPPGRPCCPTLMELAMNAVVANIEMCVMASRELWSRLPQAILLDIYDRVSAKNRLTLEAWCLLSTTLFAKREELRRCIIHNSARISPPSSGGPLDPESFTLCFGPTWSPDSSIITHVTLDATCELDTPHLLLLPDMPNLGLLRIVEPRDPSTARPRITDRVIRAWAERKDPFPVLRILQLSCCINLTPEILRYLGSFPALAYVTVRALRSNWDSRSVFAAAPGLGWRVGGWPEQVQALMRRYFASCMGLRDGPLRRSEMAAAVVSAGKPARLSLLFDDVSTVQFGARPAVLPWEGGLPSPASDPSDAVHVERMKDTPASEGGATGGSDLFPWVGGFSFAERPAPATDARLHNPHVGGILNGYAWELQNNEPRKVKVNVHDNPAWWLYAAIGHVILRDGDLEPTDGPGGAVPTSNGWVLPPRPVLSLIMAADEAAATSQGGGAPSGQAIDPLTKHVFVRESAFKEVASRETAWVPEKVAPPRESKERGTGPAKGRACDAPLRQRKKMKMGDVLSSMAGG